MDAIHLPKHDHQSVKSLFVEEIFHSQKFGDAVALREPWKRPRTD